MRSHVFLSQLPLTSNNTNKTCKILSRAGLHICLNGTVQFHGGTLHRTIIESKPNLNFRLEVWRLEAPHWTGWSRITLMSSNLTEAMSGTFGKMKCSVFVVNTRLQFVIFIYWFSNKSHVIGCRYSVEFYQNMIIDLGFSWKLRKSLWCTVGQCPNVHHRHCPIEAYLQKWDTSSISELNWIPQNLRHML